MVMLPEMPQATPFGASSLTRVSERDGATVRSTERIGERDVDVKV
jgi:hypothetical protein